MNGKFEEKLAELAFGDLSPEEAKRIEAQAMADPAAAQTLNMYRSMRTGLRELHDVPEDQMSKERLRDAILAQGLKPKPERSASPLGWLWMPGTAAVLAAGLMLFQNMNRAEPSLIAQKDPVDDSRVVLNVPESVSKPTISVEPDPVETPRVVAQPTETPKATVARKPRPRRRAPERVEPRLEFVRFEDGPSYGQLMARNDVKPDITALPETTRSTEVEMPTDTAPIVIIEENRDTTTGAFKATEVGASNVLIGG